MSGAEKRLHLDRFELAERGNRWDAEDGGEVDATEVAAELRSLRAAAEDERERRASEVKHDVNTCPYCCTDCSCMLECRGKLTARMAMLEAQIAESPVVRRNAVRAAVEAERHRVYLLLTQRATAAATNGDTAAARTLLQAATATLEEQGGR